METMFKSLSPLGDASMKMFSDLMTVGLGAAGKKG
jgi:hypothetical protein